MGRERIGGTLDGIAWGISLETGSVSESDDLESVVYIKGPLSFRMRVLDCVGLEVCLGRYG